MLAEEQIAGRGRLDRRWHAPAGQCLLMSLLFRPGEPFAHRAARITMLCGLALAEAAAKVAGIEVQLKWPNDLIVAREDGAWRKIAGMLSEIGGAAQQPDLLVVGLGLNVNVPSAALAKLAPNAGSLRAEIGHPVDRVAILDDFLKRLESPTPAGHPAGIRCARGKRAWRGSARRSASTRRMLFTRAQPSASMPKARSCCGNSTDLVAPSPSATSASVPTIEKGRHLRYLQPPL